MVDDDRNTVKELQEEAAKLDIPGRSSMNKHDLEDAIEDVKEEGGTGGLSFAYGEEDPKSDYHRENSAKDGKGGTSFNYGSTK